MIKVNAALKTILGSVRNKGLEAVKLIAAVERVLSEDIYAKENIPAFDNSAMDGYAVKSLDTAGASGDKPKTLEVVSDLKAGDVPKKMLKNNQAIRIMTGAPIPSGADSVVMVEFTEKEHRAKSTGQRVKVFQEVGRGENIRRKGEDIKKGEWVIPKGTLLNSGHIGILASLGRAKIKVAKRPRVAILATGDEVVDVDEKLEPGKIRSSNTYTLLSQVRECGGIPKNLGIAKDKPHSLEKKIKQGLDCDIILTSGGVSVGDYDLVKDILAKMGTNIRFWQVAMRPGKPLVFGTIKNKLVFGLPGNPVSSMVSFEFFVRPTILKMLGQKIDDRKEVSAILEEGLQKKKGVQYFLRAKTHWQEGSYFTRTTGPQGSGILKSMALANSLIILSEEQEFIRKGTRVTVRFLD